LDVYEKVCDISRRGGEIWRMNRKL